MSTNSIMPFHNHAAKVVRWLSQDQQNWDHRLDFVDEYTPCTSYKLFYATLTLSVLRFNIKTKHVLVMSAFEKLGDKFGE